MNERSEKQEEDQRKTHLESHEAERKITRKNKWNAADGFNVADLGSSTWLNATEIYWSANCFFSLSLFTDFHLPLICMRVAKCMIYVEPEWKIMTLPIDKKTHCGDENGLSVFSLLQFHSHLYFSSLVRSSSLATVFLTHRRDLGPVPPLSDWLFYTVLPPPPLHWHHCWRSVISCSNNRQLLCCSAELISRRRVCCQTTPPQWS